MGKHFVSYGLGIFRFKHARTLDARIDAAIARVMRGCSCCSMCKQGAHCYIPPCIYA